MQTRKVLERVERKVGNKGNQREEKIMNIKTDGRES